MKNHLVKLSLVSCLLLPGINVQAEPWVDTSNIFLRASIQQLADIGIIKTPVTTFPLMWHDIAADLRNSSSYNLDTSTKNAFSYVLHELKLAKRNQRKLEVNLASKSNRFTSFGDSFRDKNNISLHSSFMTSYFAVNLSPSYTASPNDDDELRYDGSYVAAFAGNWVVTLGMQDRWWGPGWDSNLSMTNNARPIPAVALSRKSAQPLSIPFTDWDIPWTVTSYMGVMDDKRIVKDTLLWGFRLNFKPFENLEIGVTRLAQWAGDGRNKDIETFWNVLKGQDNCGGNGPTVEECKNGAEPGNQLAGWDFRWSTSLFEQPLGVYFSLFAEDGDRRGGLNFFGEERYQVGFDTRFNAFNHDWLFYVEGADTYALCKDGVNGDGTSTIGDCYYEHHIYKTGMRYKGRNIGNLYENDATSLVFGLVSQENSDINYEFKFRWLQLNKDNHDKAPNNPLIGNTLTPIAEDMLMLSGKAQYSYKNWRYTFGTKLSESKYDNDISTKTDINVSLTIEYNL
jgi:hypothetical protein